MQAQLLCEAGTWFANLSNRTAMTPGGQEIMTRDMNTILTLTITIFLVTVGVCIVRSAQAADFVLIAQTDEGCTLYLDGTDLVAEGCNVHIRNNKGATDTTDGTGNLIVGFDEDEQDDRSGSHNVVVGPYHSYPSYGGLIAGYDNEAGGAFATVAGGRANDAYGDWATISGGYSNVASGDYSSVSAGQYNDAYGSYSSVSGGYFCDARGTHSSVTGGYWNQAWGESASVTGGFSNQSWGEYTSVTGGYGNQAWGESASVTGGIVNMAGGDYATVTGGLSNWASGYTSSISGGYANQTSTDYESILGAHVYIWGPDHYWL